MEDQITEQPGPLKISLDTNAMMTVIGVLVSRLGGKVEIRQEDFENLNGKMIGERMQPHVYTLEVVDARVFGPGPASLN